MHISTTAYNYCYFGSVMFCKGVHVYTFKLLGTMDTVGMERIMEEILVPFEAPIDPMIPLLAEGIHQDELSVTG